MAGGRRAIDPMEALEDPRKFGLGDAGATVRDAQSSVAVLCVETGLASEKWRVPDEL